MEFHANTHVSEIVEPGTRQAERQSYRQRVGINEQ
jgi:hypothetical protein